jgi:hypothetical protein
MPTEGLQRDAIRQLLRDMVLFHQCVDQTLKSKAARQSWYRKTEGIAEALKARLINPDFHVALDEQFEHISELARDPVATEQAKTTIRGDAAHFIAVEMQLRNIIDLPSSAYWRAVVFATHKGGTLVEAADPSRVATSGRDYAQRLITLIDFALASIQSTRELSRKAKKRSRIDLTLLIWRQLIGGAIFLANGYQFMEHGGPYYSTSVICGAGLMGYSGSLSRTLTRALGSRSIKRKKQAQSVAHLPPKRSQNRKLASH